MPLRAALLDVGFEVVRMGGQRGRVRPILQQIRQALVGRLDVAIEILDALDGGARMVDGRYAQGPEFALQLGAALAHLALDLDGFVRAAGNVEFPPVRQGHADGANRRNRRGLASRELETFVVAVAVQRDGGIPLRRQHDTQTHRLGANLELAKRLLPFRQGRHPVRGDIRQRGPLAPKRLQGPLPRPDTLQAPSQRLQIQPDAAYLLNLPQARLAFAGRIQLDPQRLRLFVQRRQRHTRLLLGLQGAIRLALPATDLILRPLECGGGFGQRFPIRVDRAQTLPRRLEFALVPLQILPQQFHLRKRIRQGRGLRLGLGPPAVAHIDFLAQAQKLLRLRLDLGHARAHIGQFGFQLSARFAGDVQRAIFGDAAGSGELAGLFVAAAIGDTFDEGVEIDLCEVCADASAGVVIPGGPIGRLALPCPQVPQQPPVLGLARAPTRPAAADEFEDAPIGRVPLRDGRPASTAIFAEFARRGLQKGLMDLEAAAAGFEYDGHVRNQAGSRGPQAFDSVSGDGVPVEQGAGGRHQQRRLAGFVAGRQDVESVAERPDANGRREGTRISQFDTLEFHRAPPSAPVLPTSAVSRAIMTSKAPSPRSPGCMFRSAQSD
jgi:hypothetical protein